MQGLQVSYGCHFSATVQHQHTKPLDNLDPEIKALMTAKQVQFNGFLFNLNGNRTRPALLYHGNYNTFPEQNNLLVFFKILKRHGLLTRPNKLGKIVYVEDQYANCQLMKKYFKDLEIKERLLIFKNGQEVI